MIPITRPELGEEEARAASEVVRSGWLAQGARVAQFEQAVAAYLGCPHAVAVSSGTAALHLTLSAHKIGSGDEVIVPSLSYIATANAIVHAGAQPVFVDVDERTFNLNPACIEPAITSRSRAILVVHQLGLPAEMDPILEIAGRHGLLVLEDAACALGATYGGRPVGSSGTPCCFSFHPRKVITTGEGGMITTSDDTLADLLRALRSQGNRLPADERHRTGRVVADEFTCLGYNYRMTDIQAAVGIEQMKRLDRLLDRRRTLARRYSRLLGAMDGIVVPLEPDGVTHTYQSYMILLEGSWSRQAIMQHMLDQQIATRPAVTAIHTQPLYREIIGAVAPLPVTERVTRQGLMLPLYPALNEHDQDRVVESLIEACKRF